MFLLTSWQAIGFYKEGKTWKINVILFLILFWPWGSELRIVAFMRLGLDDSTQIAKFLGLSLNTIYTYRNKVKTRAINRDTFEKDVRNIGRNPSRQG